MVLQDYRQIIAKGFIALEKEHLSDEGIAAVCDIRKAAAELYEHAVNYQDALTLLNRLTKSAVDDAREQDVFSNPFWDEQEANRGRTSDVFSDTAVKEEPVKEEPVKEEPAEEEVKSKPRITFIDPKEDVPVPKRMSVRGSGKIAPISKIQNFEDEPVVEEVFDQPDEEPVDDIALDEPIEVEAEPQVGDDISTIFDEEEDDLFIDDDPLNSQFTEVTEETLSEEEDVSQSDAAIEIEQYDCDDEPEDIFAEQGVFEEGELPDYAVSYADDPYLLADDFIENLDDEEMELFIQIGSAEDGISDDIVRPGSLEKSGPKEEPKETPAEAMENARDKFYMPAKSRIAMIRGAEPEDYFMGFDLLADGYVKDEPDEEPEVTVPTEDELANAESEFEDEIDEVEEVEEPRPSAILEKVDPPENEERDEEDPSFDGDQLGINVDQPLLMSDDEYEKQFKVEMTTTIAEQSAQAEQYKDRFEKLAAINIGRPSGLDDVIADDHDEN